MPKLSRLMGGSKNKPLRSEVKIDKVRPKPGSFSYPWEDWFKLESFILKRGKDYDCRTYIMAQQIRNKASEAGVSITVTVNPDESGLTCYVGGGATSERAEVYKK